MTNDSPFHLALAAYAQSVLAKDVDAFVALYDPDVHVFDMWGKWSLRGLVACAEWSWIGSAVFEGEYRWHRHPDSDELFLVVAGVLQIDLADGSRLELTEWQSVVIPAVQCIGHEPSGVRSTSPARRRAQRRYLSRPSPDNSFKVDGYAATQLWRRAS